MGKIEYRIESSMDGKNWRVQGIFPHGCETRFDKPMDGNVILEEAESFRKVRGREFKGVRIVIYIQ